MRFVINWLGDSKGFGFSWTEEDKDEVFMVWNGWEGLIIKRNMQEMLRLGLALDGLG